MIKSINSYTYKSFNTYSGPQGDEEFKQKNVFFGYNGKGKTALAKGILNEITKNPEVTENNYRFFDREFIKNNLLIENSTSIKGVVANFGNGYIEIDKDAYFGLDTGFNYVEESPDEPVIIPDPDYSIPVGNDTVSPQPVVMVNVSNHSFNVYSHKVENGAYDSPAYEELCELMEEYEMVPDYPGDRNKWVVSGNKFGEIKPGDLFVWFYCRKATAGGTSFTTEGDSAHKVLFRNSDGIVRYGYIQELITATEDFFLDSKRVGRENFDLYSFDAENNTLIENNHNEIYTVKRELNYKSNNGSSLGILPIGTQLRNAGNAGATNHGYIYFEECKFVGETEWHFLNQETNSGAFVDLDMQNGVSGYNRALW